MNTDGPSDKIVTLVCFPSPPNLFFFVSFYPAMSPTIFPYISHLAFNKFFIENCRMYAETITTGEMCKRNANHKSIFWCKFSKYDLGNTIIYG